MNAARGWDFLRLFLFGGTYYCYLCFSLHINFVLPILWTVSAFKSTRLPLTYGVYKSLLLATCRNIPNSSAWRGILISSSWVTSLSLSIQLWLRDLPASFAHRAAGAVPGKQNRSQRNRIADQPQRRDAASLLVLSLWFQRSSHPTEYSQLINNLSCMHLPRHWDSMPCGHCSLQHLKDGPNFSHMPPKWFHSIWHFMYNTINLNYLSHTNVKYLPTK